MAHRLTTKEFSERVANITNNEYTSMGNYINNHTKILMKHNICGETYLVEPKCFLAGNRCPHCRNKLRGAKPKTTEQFSKEVTKLTDGEYTVVGEYTGVCNKVSIRHNNCGNVWEPTPNRFLSSRSRCPVCARKLQGLQQRKTTAQFSEVLEQKYPNEYTLLSEYTRADAKVRVRHNICGNEWKVRASHLVEHNMCPRCRASKGESYVREHLTKLGLIYKEQKSFPNLRFKKPLTYDFYLPEQQVVIEYQGVQHYEPIDYFGGIKQFEAQKECDRVKREYAKKYKLQLIEIPYWENTPEKVATYLNKYLDLQCKAENP